MKPTGDCLLEVDFAQYGRTLTTPMETHSFGHYRLKGTGRPLSNVLRQLSPRVRDSLHASWFLQFQPRDDGGRGLYVIDDLWYVWSQHVDSGASMGNDC